MRARSALLVTVLASLLAVTGARGARDPDAGTELLGTPAPPWSFERWVRGGPLRLDRLRGQVVLVRWWTEGCRFCRATLPELERLRTAHAGSDLVVLGVFHPKPPRAVSDRYVLGIAKELGWNGPIALDREWKTLARYWLDADPERNWTSVSFLIDREGAIRWVHGGGEYHRSEDPRHAACDLAMRALERELATQLGEGRGAARQP